MLTEYFPPNKDILGLRAIPVNVRDRTPAEVDAYKDEIENSPQLFYCDIQIPLDGIKTLTVDTTGFLPRMTVSFTDRTNILSDAGMPGDNSLLTLRLPSRSKNLNFVHMDFKILNTTYDEVDAAKTFNMTCVASIDFMLVSQFLSFPKSTSWNVMKSLATKAGLGFRSNISDTQDPMTWVNPNVSNDEFVTDWVLPHAWNGESGYMWAFVDLYYNLTYIDVEVAMMEEGFSHPAALSHPVLQAVTSEPDIISTIILTSDPAGAQGNMQFVRPRVTNNSTATSVENGYVRDAYYYDVAGNWAGKAGAFRQFSVDSITTPGAEGSSLILKDQPGQSKFLKMNRGSSYAGRIDTDNVHPDYAYATVQNAQNLADLQKVSVTLRMPQANMNLYRFMKVPVQFSNMAKPGPNSNAINERVSGQWLITGMSYTYTNANKLEQFVSAVKRELNVKDLTK